MATTINDVRATNNPQRAYEYEVDLLGSTASGSLTVFTQRVESVAIPESSLETIEINFKGRKTMFPGRDSSPHTFTVNFYDSENREVYTFFKKWMDKANNEILGGGVTRDLLASDMLIKTFAADSQTVTGTNRLTKVFPTNVGEVSLDYASSEHMKVAITFSYDTNTIE